MYYFQIPIMADKEGETFDEAVEERVINEEYKVRTSGATGTRVTVFVGTKIKVI